LGERGPAARPGARAKKKRRRESVDASNEARDFTAGALEPEFVFDIALTQWLPGAGREPGQAQALQAAAERTNTTHNDPWLADLLRGWAERPARQALTEAIEKNLQGDSTGARAAALTAGQLFRRQGNAAAGWRADIELVYAWNRDGQYAECAKTAAAAEQAARARGYTWLAGRLKIEGGNCEAALGREGAGLAAADAVLALARQARYPVLEWRAQALANGLATNWGDPNAAWNGMLAWLGRYREAPYPAALAYRAYADLSTSAQAFGHLQAAYGFRRAAVREAALMANRPLEGIARSRLSGLAMLAGDAASAESEARAALRLVAGRREQAVAELALAETELAGGRAPEVLARLARSFPEDQKAPSEYLDLRVAQLRGAAYARAGDRGRARQNFERAVERSETRLAALGAAHDRAAPVRDGEPAYRGLADAALQEGRGEEAWRVMEWFRAADLPGARRDPQPVDLLRAMRGDALFVYADLPGGAVLWANGGLHRLPAAAEIRAVGERFARLCADPRSNAEARRRDARQLYDWLIAPGAEGLRGRETLVIEPDEATAMIPWEALQNPAGQWLGEQHAIVLARGAASYAERGERDLRVTANSALLALADPELPRAWRPAFPVLPEALAEVRGLARRFTAPVVFERGRAGVTALRTNGARAAVFHFAGHGTPQGLLLSRGGQADLLRATGIAAQDWRACRLVFLAACSSGSGEKYGYVNPESLVRAFLNAGAGRVVAARWNADSRVAAQVTDAFYGHLLAGVPAAEAMRRTAGEVRRNPATGHPYYWAAYPVFGYK